MTAGVRVHARWATLLLAVSVLGGCAVPPPIAETDNGQTQAAFSRVGRFALRIDQVGGKQDAVQGGFAWRDDGRNLTLDLATPLGTTMARVEAKPGSAVLRQSDGTETRASDPDELIATVLGSAIPVSGLRDWLRGQPAAQPPATITEHDDQNRPTAFDQDGWHVRIQQYDAIGPVRLQMARTDPDGRQVDLRLVVPTP